MSKAKPLNGKDFMVFVGGKATALATSHKLTLTAETGDAASKDDGMWDETIITKLSFEVTTDALIAADGVTNADSYEAMFDAMIASKAVDVVCGIPANLTNDGVPDAGWTVPTGVHYTGKALITSLERTDAKGSNSTMTVTMRGQGKLTKVAAATA